MGHSSGAVDSAACRVLPVIDEEPDAECEGSPEMTRMAERRKAIVSRMRELLRRAAAAQSAHCKLRRSTVATAEKWKGVVGRIQNRGASATTCKIRQRTTLPDQDDGVMTSSSSSFSSNSSFSWDAVAESCSPDMSPARCSSTLLWPSSVSVQAEAADEVSSPAASIIRLSCASSGSEDGIRMAHWATTDSDFVVLEL